MGAPSETNGQFRSARARAVMPQLPALDGLRAIAVLAVVFYHLPVSWLPGGFIGVDVFFVISGFLITSLLTAELARTRHLDLGRFWVRRARRLLPALVFMLVVVVVASALFARDALSLLRTDVPASLGYITNWWLIFHHVSYFQSIGRPPLLLHLWSLAVEEQFYLVWPLVVILVVGRGRHPGRLAWIALTGAVGSAVWMAALFHAGQDPSRAYFGTDSHCSGLLLGAALSVAFPPWRRSRLINPSARLVLNISGAVALLGLIVLMATLKQDGAFTYRGGIQLANLGAGALVVVASHPAVDVSRVLSWFPLRWVGRRSYAIYLWHWPIFELTRPHIDVPLSVWPTDVLRVVAVLAVSELSYRLVEQPWRTGAAPRALQRLWNQRRRVAVISLSTIAASGGALAVVLITAPIIPPAALASVSTPAARVVVAPYTPLPTVTTPVSVSSSAKATTGGAAPVVLAIGDSVMLDAANDLDARFGPATLVDAVVGRQVSTGIERLTEYMESGRLGHVTALVIGLGTNGPMSPAQCQEILTLAAGVPRVVMINTRMPRPWESISNNTLAGCTGSNRGVVLVNWYSAAGAPGVLGPDAIHATAAGASLYTSLVAAAVAQPLAPSIPPMTVTASQAAKRRRT